jgi:hypothetical protein
VVGDGNYKCDDLIHLLLSDDQKPNLLLSPTRPKNIKITKTPSPRLYQPKRMTPKKKMVVEEEKKKKKGGRRNESPSLNPYKKKLVAVSHIKEVSMRVSPVQVHSMFR